MASEQRHVQQYDKKWESSFFACIHNKTICLLCGYQPSSVKKFVIQKHYETKHKEYSTYVDEEKFNLIEGLKLEYIKKVVIKPLIQIIVLHVRQKQLLHHMPFRILLQNILSHLLKVDL